MKKYILSGYDVENLTFITSELHSTLEDARKSALFEINDILKEDYYFYDEIYHLGISDKIEFLITEVL
ncbi:hypothetical protein AM4_135 [Lactococcus phage AM4]|uniref:Uncharacterized protein n=2 Tax=Audreyjarvisvirus AM4 TaxID=2845189 RepID=A0A1W6JKP9_9CAUD|nr:hypothetical protein H1Z35_gp117 [Lactococcus phage AM4]ARM66793.1 hypothetical protein AM4_135 [Lactococcus phage AM4]ARM66890.1 hypothetical protein AM5_037 [Lactococcus phage AM5]